MHSLLSCLLAFALAAPSQWTVRSDRHDDPLARQVAELLPIAQREIEATLGLAFRGQGVVVLCGSGRSFRIATPGVDHRHTLGVAYPARSTIYLNCEAIEAASYESFAITLRHELSHVVVGEVIRRGHRRVPLWFYEGVAVWTSGKLPRYNVEAFDLAVRAGSLRPLDELTKAFPLDPVQRGVAYEQSESFIRFLVARHGPDAVQRILCALADGTDFTDAIALATDSNLIALHQEWLASLTPRWPWLSWAFNLVFHPYSAFGIFGAMTLLALASFAVYWRRRQRRYAEWDREERRFSSEDSPWD